MKRSKPIIALSALALVLTGCATPFLQPEDRKEACSIVVEEKFGTPVFEANLFSNVAGPLTGAALGLFIGPQAVLLVGHGTACAIAAAQHPTADATFRQFLQEADSGSLKRALESGLEAPRAECDRPAPADDLKAPPDAVVVIEKVKAGTGCLYGKQELWVEVKWRTVANRTGRVMNEAITRQQWKSSRTVEDWLEHPTEARAEIESVLEQIGGRMVARLLTDKDPSHHSAGRVPPYSTATGNPYGRSK